VSERQDMGASVPDRDLVASDGAATHLHPMGFDPSRKGLLERMPRDFVLRWHGDHLSIGATCKTTHHLEAMAAALLVLRSALPSTREAVAGDFGLEKPERPFAEQLAVFLGCAPQPPRAYPIMPRQKGGLTRAAQRTGA
jgi:hypothetical protein